jgi:hypothetical protein
MQKVGKDSVLGFAIGNEMDIFDEKTTDQQCLIELWESRYFTQMTRYVNSIDAKGFRDTPITIVWAMSVLPSVAGGPWKETPTAKVNTLVTQAFQTWRERFVWSFNVYAIWDRSLYPTSAADCEKKSAAAVSISYTQNVLKAARQSITATTGNPASTMWVGENGWSSPMAGGHAEFPWCKDYASVANLQKAYEAFMDWDLSGVDGFTGPEHVFYFTMRDASNFAAKEHFGLIIGCDDTKCKIGETNANHSNSEGAIQMV